MSDHKITENDPTGYYYNYGFIVMPVFGGGYMRRYIRRGADCPVLRAGVV